jgi:hypothetical protein
MVRDNDSQYRVLAVNLQETTRAPPPRAITRLASVADAALTRTSTVSGDAVASC